MARVVENAKKQWVANRDFDLKNLQVKKGEILSKSWTTATCRRYLQNTFGEDCIIWTDMMIDEKETNIEVEDRVRFLEREVVRLSKLVSKSDPPKVEVKPRSRRNRINR